MHRPLQLTVASLLLLAGSGSAQQTNSQPQPLPSQPRHAGTYHLATGTWSRGTSQLALAGPEVLYDNTCTVGLFFPLQQGQITLDSGRIPSTSSPAPPTSLVGTSDSYTVNGFTIAYCSFEPLVTSFDVSFYDNYAACSDGLDSIPAPLTTIHITNTPAMVSGNGCWFVNFDLSNSIMPFQLAGDGDGVFDDDELLDSFGWSLTQTIPTTAQDSGPILAGDPLGYYNSSCGGIGAGTTFPGAGVGPGTGIGQIDRLEAAFAPPFAYACHWFGGYDAVNPLAALYMQIEGYGDSGPPAPGNSYCFGDGSGATCPCSGTSSAGEGCPNTSGAGATLVASGTPSLTNDTLLFQVAGVPGSKPGLLLRGDNRVSLPAGDGILCLAGNSARSQVVVTNGGQVTLTDFQGAPFGSVSNPGAETQFQFWYRDPSNTCSGAGFNFSNGWSVIYGL